MNGDPDCARPPEGWYCTLPAGHEGPCPAWPKGDIEYFHEAGDARPKFVGPGSQPAVNRLINKLVAHATRPVSRETLRRGAVVAEFVYTYQAEVLRIVDGDTLDMRAWKELDFGFGNKITGSHTGRFRLVICDTPERGEHGWAEATEFVRDLLPVGTVATINTYRDPDNFGRYLADVLIPGQGTTTLSSELLRLGYAVPYKR